MFGYIKVDKANLLGKEYDAYKGVYCALCRQLGREYSLFARFILNYDCTFYAVLALDLAVQPPTYCQGRCRFNPLKKCNYAQTSTKALSLAAALTVSSAYYKLKDNLYDSPWYKRILYRLIQPIFSRWHKKSRKKYPEIDTATERMLSSQLDAEADPNCSVDQAAQPTADMLASVCELIPDHIAIQNAQRSDSIKRILHTFGYFLGRWIYLIDAADDYKNDKKHHGFNPFLLNSEPQDVRAYIEPMLNHALSETLLSYGLLDSGCYDLIIKNVLLISCQNIQNQILSRYTNQPTE